MKASLLLFVLIGIFVAAGLFVVSQRFFMPDMSNEFRLPKGGETKTEMGTVTQNGERETKELMVTNGTRHTVPLEEITTLLPPDGIPSLDNPTFVSVEKANGWLADEEPGIAFSQGNTHRFYPYLILVWHEVVNDVVEGERILVTYCPLCLTGFVLDPLVKGERVEFGTSGKLWKSNLVMYDRKTKSLWSQVLAQAIVGEMAGAKLRILPSDQVRYGDWKKAHPNGEVLSRDTGFSRRYGQYPYAGGDYFGVDTLSRTLVGNFDPRLPMDAFVFGIVVNGKAKAYDIKSVKEKGEVQDLFEGKRIVLRRDKELDAVRVFEQLPDGSEKRINPVSGFWFSWAAAHPDTEVYQ